MPVGKTHFFLLLLLSEYLVLIFIILARRWEIHDSSRVY
jgi:hypothetical protein